MQNANDNAERNGLSLGFFRGDLSGSSRLDDVVSIRLGANPLGMKCTFWVRGVKILRARSASLK